MSRVKLRVMAIRFSNITVLYGYIPGGILFTPLLHTPLAARENRKA